MRRVILKTFMKKGILLLVFTLVISLLAACSGNQAEPAASPTSDASSNEQATATPSEPPAAAPSEPVELTFLSPWGEESWENMFGKELKAKFPHITWKLIPTLEPEMIAAGNIPDIVSVANWGHIYSNVQNNVLLDLTPMLESHELARLEKGNMDAVRAGGNGKIYTLPWNRAVEKLVINTEVFDKFNIPYPDMTKPMTWDETVELAKQLTGTVDGVQYRGIDLQNPGYILAEKLPVELNANNEPQYQKDPAFRQYFEYLQAFWSIPGIFPEGQNPSEVVYRGHDDFVTQKNIAMLVYWGIEWALVPAEKDNGLKWDYRPMPVWPDLPNIGPASYSNTLGIGSNTKHKEQAFEVLKYIISDEFQMAKAKEGGLPISTTAEVEQAYIDYSRENMGEKNFQALFALKPASPEVAELPRYYGAQVGTWEVSQAFATLDKDINTVLREMDEQTLKNIEEMKAQGK
jgi:multiple sugar transport system substrate-binding protein